MKSVFKLVVVLVAICISSAVSAQEFLSPDSIRSIKYKSSYTTVKNHSFFMLGADDKNCISALNGYVLPNLKPAVWTIAPFTGGEMLFADKQTIKLKNIFHGDPLNETKIIKLKNKLPKELAFSPDGTFLLIATDDNKLIKCSSNAKTKKEEKVKFELQLADASSSIKINKAANTALIVEKNQVEVINLERGAVRKALKFDTDVNDVAFSGDFREFSVLLANGSLRMIDIASLTEKKSYQLSGGAKKCRIMNQGKYAVVANDDTFSFLNLITSHIDYILNADNAALLGLDIFTDSFNYEQMIAFYDTRFDNLHLNSVERYHTMDLKHELELRMAEWSKMLPNESESDYRLRVNDESRAKHALELERQLVTGMAGDLIGAETAKFGNYFENNQALAIDFNSMPSIYLNIPAADLNDLKTIDDLEFFNTLYGLTEDDTFEVIYTEARNKNTGKVYIYDNLSRKSMAFDNESFVPMEVVQLANIESAKLETLKEEVVTAAKSDNILTDHTHISVSTEVEKDVDADGNKILNYRIDYMYEVDEEFSARDDFKAGKYNTTESNAAMQMMNIVKSSIEGDFKKYTTDSNKLEISVTGSADAVPIIGTLAYKGEYGDITDQLVYQDNELTKMTITKAQGIKSNEQLALVRAMGVADYLNKNVLTDVSIPTSFKHFVEVSKEKGSKYRRIKVSMKFFDAFKDTNK